MGAAVGRRFAKSGKVADLPGCSGRIPKDSPQVETVLHDAKHALADAEELVDKHKLDKLDKVDALLKTVEESLAKAAPMHPELPDRWEAAQPLYTRMVGTLRQRRRLAPSLEKLRTAYQASVTAGKSLQSDPAPALSAAKTCVAAFAEPRSAGVTFTVEAELDPGHPRALKESLEVCELQAKTAEPLVREREKAAAKAQRDALKKSKAKSKSAKRHQAGSPPYRGGATICRIPEPAGFAYRPGSH